ncbi:MAG: helix-turn-helix domain-containing protein [Pseudomonadota bacterium]
MRRVSGALFKPVVGISSSAWSLIIRKSNAIQANAGDIVWAPKRNLAEIGIIAAGMVNIESVQDGYRYKSPLFRGAPDIIQNGEFQPLHTIRYEAIATQDGTQILYVSDALLRELLRLDESFATFVIACLSRRQQRFYSIVDVLTEPRSSVKVAKFINGVWASQTVFNFTQREMAYELGISRVSVANAITELRQNGLVTGRGRSMKVVSVEELNDWIDRNTTKKSGPMNGALEI